MIAPLEKVVRSDGTRILLAEALSTKEEIKRISRTMTSKLIALSAIWAFWSFFYGLVCHRRHEKRGANRRQWYLVDLPRDLLFCSRPRLVIAHFALFLHVSILCSVLPYNVG